MTTSEFSSSRRRFLRLAGAAGFGALTTPLDLFAQYRFLAPVRIDNPLANYPNRDWERMYRDIYRTDKLHAGRLVHLSACAFGGRCRGDAARARVDAGVC